MEKAKELEKKYDWLQAAKIFEEVSEIALTEENILEAARIQEQMGYSYFRSALQASTNKQFQHRMLQAVEADRRASELFQKLDDEKYAAKVFASQAKAVYASSWIETDPAKKRDLLNEWWDLNSNSLKLFEKIGDQLAIVTICNDLMEGSMDCKYWIAPNWEESVKLRKELISFGERAISILSKMNDVYQLARAYCWSSCYYLIDNVAVIEYEKELIEKGSVYCKQALKYSQKIGDPWLLGWSNQAAYYCALSTNDPDLEKILKKTIECLSLIHI